jgi:hypothetical protein
MNQSRVSVYRQTYWCHRYFNGSKPFAARAPLAIAMACFSDKCHSPIGFCVAQPAKVAMTTKTATRSIDLTRIRLQAAIYFLLSRRSTG